MLTIFTKPLHEVESEDISEMIRSRWPEAYTVEYKRSLPNKSGGTDAWDQGKNEVGAYARDELLAEVIALANTDGGFVFLGIDETDEKPPRAKDIFPQRDVRDLARRLEDQARSCIDPPLGLLQVHPVETDGTTGVVIFKVAPSRSAPHRLSSTREAFARRGPSTVRITMREIQEMAITVARRSNDIESRLDVHRLAFQRWRKSTEPVTFRITAIAIDPIPDSPRLFDRSRLFFGLRCYTARIAGRKYELDSIASHCSERPIMRGVAGDVSTNAGRLRVEQYQTGAINYWHARSAEGCGRTGLEPPRLYHGWVLSGIANVLRLLNEHRQKVGFGDAEFGVEVEVVRQPCTEDKIPRYFGLGDDSFGTNTYEIPNEMIRPPVYSVTRSDEFDGVINAFDADIYDTLGARLGLEAPIKVDW